MADAAFDPDAYLASKQSANTGFDPDAYLKSKGQGPTSLGDKLQTGLENYGNVMTLGYLPQLQSASEKMMANVFGEKGEDYVKDRDANIQRIQQESQENPNSALVGKGLGVVNSAMVMPGGVFGGGAKTVLGAAAKGAGMGAGYGYLSNPGDKEGVYDPNQYGERALNAAKGAAIGGVTGGVTQGLLNLKDAPDAVTGLANEQAVAQTHPMLKDYRTMDARGNEQELGQWLRDKGIVQAGDTFEDVARKAADAKAQAGKQLDELYTSSSKPFDEANAQTVELNPNQEIASAPKDNSELPGFNPARDKKELLEKISLDPDVANSPRAQSILKTASDYIDSQADRFGNRVLSPKESQLLKTGLDKEINYARNPLSKEPTSEGAFSPTREYIAGKIEDQFQHLADSGADPDLVDKLRTANKDYGNAAKTVDMAGDYAQRMNTNNKVGLSDWLAAGTGAAAGSGAGLVLDRGEGGHGSPMVNGALGLLGGIAAGAGNRVMRTRGPGLISGAASAVEPVANAIAPISEGANSIANSLGVNSGSLSKAAVLGLLQKQKEKKP